MKGRGIALQLYSVRDDCARDFFGTLGKVAEMGFEGVEFAGFYGKTAGEVRDKLRELGLAVAGSHESLQRVIGEALEDTLRFNLELGNRNIVVPWLPPEMRRDREGWERSAEQLGSIAERVSGRGLRLGYHNHREEFLQINGEYPWDVFFRRAGPKVFTQLDTGNALSAGIRDEVLFETIRKYPGRSLTIHLKDYSRTRGFVLLGEGDVPFKKVIEACMDVGGTEWFIVEIETYPYPPLESVRRCLESLRNIL